MVQDSEAIIFLADTCHNIIARGVCNEEKCERCNKRFCTVCSVVLPSEGVVREHVQGQKHRKYIDERDNCPYPSFCNICEMPFKTPFAYPAHIETHRHRQNLLRKSKDAEIGLNTVRPGSGFSHCNICHKTFPKAREERHQTTYIHRKRLRFIKLQNETGSGKHGVTMKEDKPFGEIVPTGQNISNFTISSTTEENIVLKSIKLKSSANRKKQLRSAFSIQHSALPKKLTTHSPELIVVLFDPQGVPGRYRDRVEIVLQSPDETFVLTKSLQATVEGNKGGWDLFEHQADFVKLD